MLLAWNAECLFQKRTKSFVLRFAENHGGISIKKKYIKTIIHLLANVVIRYSFVQEMTILSIAPTLAISMTDIIRRIIMNNNQFTSELKYQSVMSVVRKMLEEGLIDEADYTIIDTNMKEKYQPFLGSL
mgnify:CR=1 FL=1